MEKSPGFMVLGFVAAIMAIAAIVFGADRIWVVAVPAAIGAVLLAFSRSNIKQYALQLSRESYNAGKTDGIAIGHTEADQSRDALREMFRPLEHPA